MCLLGRECVHAWVPLAITAASCVLHISYCQTIVLGHAKGSVVFSFSVTAVYRSITGHRLPGLSYFAGQQSLPVSYVGIIAATSQAEK